MIVMERWTIRIIHEHSVYQLVLHSWQGGMSISDMSDLLGGSMCIGGTEGMCQNGHVGVKGQLFLSSM